MSEYELKPQELKSCPFCGGTHIEIGHDDDGEARVVCAESEACGATIGWQPNMETAIAAWNTRAGGE